MSTSQNTSKSIVGSVASHEKELLGQLEASKGESREIIDQARADARAFQLDAESKLNDDITQVRREKEAARESKFQATVDAADARLTGVRDQAASQVDAMADKVLSMLMPKGGN